LDESGSFRHDCHVWLVDGSQVLQKDRRVARLLRSFDKKAGSGSPPWYHLLNIESNKWSIRGSCRAGDRSSQQHH